MSHLKFFLLVIAFLHCSRLVAQSDEPVRRIEDVIYGRKSGMALTMDVFQPAQPNGCGLLFLVNGGWLSSKATPLMVTIRPDVYGTYLERGYTVFAVVTSSQPKFAIPEQMDDVQRAVRFVRANAMKYGVRPDRFGVLGSSSGGHLTLSIATQGSPGKADSTDPVERESSAVQAAACFFPPTDFLNYGGPGISGVGEGPLAPLKAAFGPRALTLEGRESLGREISPINFVTAQLPPTLIIHGDDDKVVPLQQSESFVKRAKVAGAPHADLIIRPGKGHGWGDFWKSTEDITAFADWFDRHLRGPAGDLQKPALQKSPALQKLQEPKSEKNAGREAERPEGFEPIFNGRDLTKWEGSADYWKVQDNCLTGTADGTLKYNRFIVWRGGNVENFELRVQVKVSPAGNSGLQYRGTERPDLGESVITGYQCDVVAGRADYDGMLYEERGRRILAHTGERVVIDPQGQPWVVGEFKLKAFKPGEWHNYRVLVEGNHHRHWIDSHPTVDVVDLDEKGRKLKGVLGMQVHVGPPMTIQFRNMLLKQLPSDLPLLTQEQAPIPADARKVVPQGQDKPKTPDPE